MKKVHKQDIDWEAEIRALKQEIEGVKHRLQKEIQQLQAEKKGARRKLNRLREERNRSTRGHTVEKRDANLVRAQHSPKVFGPEIANWLVQMSTDETIRAFGKKLGEEELKSKVELRNSRNSPNDGVKPPHYVCVKSSSAGRA